MARFTSVRTTEEVEEARQRAQRATYAAEDQDGRDEGASAIYDLLQWLAGDSDIDPTEEMGDDEDPEDG